MRGAPLSWSSPDDWSARARGGLLLLIAVLAALVLGHLSLQSDLRTLQQLRAQAQQAREDYRSRLAQGQALAALRARRVALRDALWPQAPGEQMSFPAQAWTEALLRDIHRAGQGRLRFELFRPGTSVTRPHHEELPFTLRVVGTYQNIAAFVAENGRLVVVTRGRADDDEPDTLPWPMSRKDLSRFTENGLKETAFIVMPPDDAGGMVINVRPR